jgi:hypothetical protein
MPPPRLVIATDECFVTGFEVQDLHGVTAALELPDRVEQVREVFALADVDAEGDAPDRLHRARRQVGEGRDQRRRQVVDAVEPHVLEALDGVALPGAAHAGDHDEVERLGRHSV